MFKANAARCMIPLVLCAAGSATAQNPAGDAAADYPNRPVTVVIGFAAGGTTDTEGRLYTDKMQASMGQSFVYDYRPGAGGTIGVGYFMRSAPDGYTLLIGNSGMAVFPNHYPELNHRVIKTIEEIALLSTRSTAILSSVAALPNVHTLKDLVEYDHANPGKLNCNTSGAGGITHTVCVAFSRALGITVTPVHYKGVALGQVDLISGRVQLSAGTLFFAQKQIAAGKLRPLAIIGNERSSLMPELPTSDEQGYVFKYPSWAGAFAPPGTPKPIIDKLNAEFVKAVHSPDVEKALRGVGSVPQGSTAEEFRARFHEELDYWQKIVKESKITLR